MIRTDLDIPVFQYETEGDVGGTGTFAMARQPDSRRLVTWEVAGTAHADDAIANTGQRSTGVTSFDIIAVCGGVREHRAARRGAAHSLTRRSDAWVASGKQPPSAPVLETNGATCSSATPTTTHVGGVRTPGRRTAPTATLLSVHQSENRICRLFGSTDPVDARSGSRSSIRRTPTTSPR